MVDKHRYVLRAMAVCTGSFATIATAAAPGGEQLFRQRCQLCHVAAPAPATLAPSLSGIIGRKAASTNYAGYSAALKASGIVWNRANLDQFLAGPAKLVPGTRMVIAITDPAQRKAIIDYLSAKR